MVMISISSQTFDCMWFLTLNLETKLIMSCLMKGYQENVVKSYYWKKFVVNA
jgi:hypothetical protein